MREAEEMKEEYGRTHLEVKSFTTKKDTVLKLCTIGFIPFYAMLVE